MISLATGVSALSFVFFLIFLVEWLTASPFDCDPENERNALRFAVFFGLLAVGSLAVWVAP